MVAVGCIQPTPTTDTVHHVLPLDCIFTSSTAHSKAFKGIHSIHPATWNRQKLEQITAEESFNTRRFYPKIFISCTKLKESRLTYTYISCDSLSFVQLMKIFGSKRLVLNDSSPVICSSICPLINSNMQQWTFTVSKWNSHTYHTGVSGLAVLLDFAHYTSGPYFLAPTHPTYKQKSKVLCFNTIHIRKCQLSWIG